MKVWYVRGLVFGAATLFGASAMAQSASDTIAGAPSITATPFSATTDVSGATSTPDEPVPCAGSGQGSVWYAFTPSSGDAVAVDTFGSSYDTVLSVWDGAPGGTLVGCNDDSRGLQSSVTFTPQVGHTYYLQVAYYGAPAPGSVLSLQIAPPPPPFAASVTVDPTGRASGSTGVIEIGGTVSCNRPGFVSLYGWVQQQTGRGATTAAQNASLRCDATPTRWTLRTVGSNARFTPGQALAVVVGSAYEGGVFSASVPFNISANLRLQGVGPKELTLPAQPSPTP